MNKWRAYIITEPYTGKKREVGVEQLIKKYDDGKCEIWESRQVMWPKSMTIARIWAWWLNLIDRQKQEK